MFGVSSTATATSSKDVEVSQPPDDSISCIKFSPASIQQTYLIASSWANDIRCWEIQANGQTIAKAMQKHDAPILNCCWSEDGSKVFTASCDKTAKMWDLQSNAFIQIAAHDQPIRTIHYIQRPSYSCVMTGSWDRTGKKKNLLLRKKKNDFLIIALVKFWDTRQATPLKQFTFSERIYAADIFGPMAVITTADRGIYVYSLDQGPIEYKKFDSLLKYQHRCISIFPDKTRKPHGFAIGSIEGRVAIMYVDTANPVVDNFTFKCHRSNPTPPLNIQDIYSVNDIAFHPLHNTLATVGSDGRYSFWDKDERTKLKTSDLINDQSMTCCAFDSRGQLFAYASSYDWHKGHEGNIQTKKNAIFLRQCFEEMKPRQKK
jgi:mRNA export factor